MSLIELNDVGANGVEYSGGQSLSRNTKNTGELGGAGRLSESILLKLWKIVKSS